MGSKPDAKDQPPTPVAAPGDATASGGAAAEPEFIKPYVSCDGDVCSTVDVSGTTRLGEPYPAKLCPDVRKVGRPFRPVPIPAIDPAAMRPEEPEFANELQWVTGQIQSGACTCCHDSAKDGYAARWDIAVGGPWIDQFSSRGLAIMAGRLDSPAFGTKAGVDINGFSREKSGASTTDPDRMRAFFDAELARRGVTAADLEAMQAAEAR
jgi:hypothetical protein